MDILHSAVTEAHNVNTDGEGSYRVRDFTETVTIDEISAMRAATLRHIADTHSPRHIHKVEGACRSKGIAAEITLNMASFEAMLTSCSLALMACERNAFAVTRPPEHHATKEKAQGFCFFNNVAIATSPLIKIGKKVCIVDIDGHHGNGTQSIFRHESNVLFCSVHQDGAYPCSGRPNDIGKAESKGRVINIPVLSGSGDDIFLETLNFFGRHVERFNPDHIAISAGFDGYHQDTLLTLRYSERGFYEAGRLLSSLDKPTFAVLEGGYHSNVKGCVEALVDGLSGRSSTTSEDLSVSDTRCHERLSSVLAKIVRSYAQQ